MDDVWESTYFSRTLTPSEAAADYSGDGHSNRIKSLFGINPITPGTLLTIGAPQVASGTALFTYKTVKGILYQGQTSADLRTWTNLNQPFEGLGGTQQSTAPANGTALFFRLQSVTPRLDTDGDGLDDYEEFLLGTDPTKADTDSDGLTDLEEFRLKNYYGVNVDPLKKFTVPGVMDGTGDADGDGISDIAELRGGSNPSNPLSYPANSPTLDTDHNGLPDAWEMQYFGHLGNDPKGDPDGDGLTNLQEYLLHTNPTLLKSNGNQIDGQADQDGDGVPDVWELEDGTDPFNANSVDLATNYDALKGVVQHLSSWGAVSNQVQFNGTVMRATAIGFETAQQTKSSKTYGIVNEVTNFLPSGNNYVAQNFMRFRKGVQYKVEMLTTSNNLPFISGKYFWTTSGNADDLDNKVFAYDVDNRQRYRSDVSGVPIAADTTISPNPDVNGTHFTLKSPGQGGPDTVLYPTGKAVVPRVEIVRETQPGSGSFASIKAPGSGVSRLPLFRTDSGANLDEIEGTTTELSARLTRNLSNQVLDSMTVTFRRGVVTFTGLLTETVADSGVFRSNDNTFTLALNPVVQTNNVTQEVLQAAVTSSAAGLSNAPFTLHETSPNSLNFVAASTMTLVDFTGPLDPATPDAVSVQLIDSFYSQTIQATLTETGPNTGVFTRTAGDVTLTLNSFSGVDPSVVDTATVSIVATALPVPSYTVALTETAPNSREFSNLGAHLRGNVTPETPTTNGQGVFYVQIKGFQDATPVKLKVGGSEATVQAMPVPNASNLLRTGKLALLETGDPFAAGDITTLLAADTSVATSAEIYDSPVAKPTLLRTAFFGRCMSWAQMPSGKDHLLNVSDKVVKKLGWTASVVNQAMTKADVLTAIPKNGLWYSFGHGISQDGTSAGSFTGFQVWASGNPLNWKTSVIQPSDVSGVIGSNQYELVFLNSCLATDPRDGSQAAALAAAFKANAYVGWDDEQNISEGAGAAFDFFETLNGINPTTNAPFTVSDGISAANLKLGPRSGTTTMTIIGDGTRVIDLTP